MLIENHTFITKRKSNMKIILFVLICVYLHNINGSYAQTNNLEIPVSPIGKSELILKRKNYTLLFNEETNLPIWVAWRLDKQRLVEKVSRKGYNFKPDPDLNPTQAVVTQDYAHSGYDRGHMCPAGDSRWCEEAMKESFYMTNICPQHPNLNGGDWHELEQACRRWAIEGPIYIVCGPILYKQSSPKYIGKGHKVLVPEAFFKVILAGVENGNPKAIGFIYKNTAGNHPLDAYVNSVDQVERITGLNFFSMLPDEVENSIEKEYKMEDWK